MALFIINVLCWPTWCLCWCNSFKLIAFTTSEKMTCAVVGLIRKFTVLAWFTMPYFMCERIYIHWYVGRETNQLTVGFHHAPIGRCWMLNRSKLARWTHSQEITNTFRRTVDRFRTRFKSCMHYIYNIRRTTWFFRSLHVDNTAIFLLN